MGVYYFYKKSAKQRANLKKTFAFLGQKSVIPTRVGGTRWVGHMLLAVESFMKGYSAIATQLHDVVASKKQQVRSLKKQKLPESHEIF